MSSPLCRVSEKAKGETGIGSSLTRATHSAKLKLSLAYAPLAQLAEHALPKRMVVGSIPTGA